MKPTFALVAAVVAFAFAWFFAGPAQLGGGATYVTTHGDSMQPRITAGDLVLVRPLPKYRVGDAVAYRSEQLGTVVLHRIVALDDDRYVLQGDNNSWLDPERPTHEQLVGAQWLHIPGGGAAAHTRRRGRRDRRMVTEHPAPRPRGSGA